MEASQKDSPFKRLLEDKKEFTPHDKMLKLSIQKPEYLSKLTHKGTTPREVMSSDPPTRTIPDLSPQGSLIGCTEIVSELIRASKSEQKDKTLFGKNLIELVEFLSIMESPDDQKNQINESFTTEESIEIDTPILPILSTKSLIDQAVSSFIKKGNSSRANYYFQEILNFIPDFSTNDSIFRNSETETSHTACEAYLILIWSFSSQLSNLFSNSIKSYSGEVVFKYTDENVNNITKYLCNNMDPQILLMKALCNTQSDYSHKEYLAIKNELMFE